MSDEMKSYVKQWITKAEEDLIVVNQLMKMEYPPKGAVGFHCQQSAEKFLKAFLLFHDVDIPKTHNIEYLLELARKYNSGFESIDPGNLTDYGVEVRYPGDFLEPSIDEIKSFLNIVEDIKTKSLKDLKL
jgi:HEPN domain-containing protein